jgi:hypothetical protein
MVKTRNRCGTSTITAFPLLQPAPYIMTSCIYFTLVFWKSWHVSGQTNFKQQFWKQHKTSAHMETCAYICRINHKFSLLHASNRTSCYSSCHSCFVPGKSQVRLLPQSSEWSFSVSYGKSLYGTSQCHVSLLSDDFQSITHNNHPIRRHITHVIYEDSFSNGQPMCCTAILAILCMIQRINKSKNLCTGAVMMIIYCMEHRSSETDRYLVYWGIPRHLLIPKILYRVHKNPLLRPTPWREGGGGNKTSAHSAARQTRVSGDPQAYKTLKLVAGSLRMESILMAEDSILESCYEIKEWLRTAGGFGPFICAIVLILTRATPVRFTTQYFL